MSVSDLRFVFDESVSTSIVPGTSEHNLPVKAFNPKLAFWVHSEAVAIGKGSPGTDDPVSAV